MDASHLIGKRYGSRVVVETTVTKKSKSTRYIKVTMRCDCGSISHTTLRHLEDDASGCMRCRLRVHGHHPFNGKCSRTYSVWANMIQRCTNPNASGYSNYGGRGIRVCKRWRSFSAFVNDMGEQSGELTLERVDNDKGYMPSNCVWASRSQQARNRRRKSGI